MGTVRIYTRASTKDQDAGRAVKPLVALSKQFFNRHEVYSENISGMRLDRPVLNRLLDESAAGDILLVESVDRLSRLTQDNFEILKQRIKERGLRLVVYDLPMTQGDFGGDDFAGNVIGLINGLLIDLMATMARVDNETRRRRVIEGMARHGYVPQGRVVNFDKHQRAIELFAQGGLTNEEIGRAVGIGVATVYRALKRYDVTDEASAKQAVVKIKQERVEHEKSLEARRKDRAKRVHA